MSRRVRVKNKDVDFHDHYESSLQDILFRWVDIRKTRILKRKFDSTNFRILDLGCGTGKITSSLQDCEVYGLDYNDKLLSMAKERGLRVKKGYFEHIPFKDGFFDAVISIDTMEHVYSRAEVLKEVKRVLKDDGYFAVFTPAYDSLTWVSAEKVAHLITRRDAGHISPFISESLQFLMKQNFRKIEDFRRINMGLGLYALARFKK